MKTYIATVTPWSVLSTYNWTFRTYETPIEAFEYTFRGSADLEELGDFLIIKDLNFLFKPIYVIEFEHGPAEVSVLRSLYDREYYYESILDFLLSQDVKIVI